MSDIDFARSFVRFTTTRVNHTPRLHLDACCAIEFPGGQTRAFYLSCPCIGEEMYVDRDLVHLPPQEFVIIVGENDEFLAIKRMPSSDDDLRLAHRVGESMPTHRGAPATVIEARATLARHTAVRPLRTYDEFRSALLENHPINGRTTYEDPDVGGRVLLEYPARTVNVANGREAWQVDAGPLLVPSEPVESDLSITRMNMGYMIYNAWDWAELAIRAPTPLSDDPAQGRTAHYSKVRRISCRHELFMVD